MSIGKSTSVPGVDDSGRPHKDRGFFRVFVTLATAFVLVSSGEGLACDGEGLAKDLARGTAGASGYTLAVANAAGGTTSERPVVANTLITGNVDAGKMRDVDLDRGDRRPQEARPTATASHHTSSDYDPTRSPIGHTTARVSRDGDERGDKTRPSCTGLPVFDVAGNPYSHTIDGPQSTDGPTRDIGTSIPFTLSPTGPAKALPSTGALTPKTIGVSAGKSRDDDGPVEMTRALHAQGTDVRGSRQVLTLGNGTSARSDSLKASHHTAAGSGAGSSATTVSWSGLPTYMPEQAARLLSFWVTRKDSMAPTALASAFSAAKVRSLTNTMDASTSLTVSKTWENEVCGIHASSATFKLQRRTKEDSGGDPIYGSWDDVTTSDMAGRPVTLTLDHESDNSTTTNSTTFVNLPCYSEDGKEYEYRAVEVSILADGLNKSVEGMSEASGLTDKLARQTGTVGGYDLEATTVAVPGTGSEPDTFRTEVTNSLRLGKVRVQVKFADDNNRDGIRPQNVQVMLSGDNDVDLSQSATSTIATMTLHEGSWEHLWDNLPIYAADGTPITYTVSEPQVSDGYSISYQAGDATDEAGDATDDAGDATDGTMYAASGYGAMMTIKNTHVPGTTKVTAEKTWVDDATYGQRPDIVLTLQSTTTENDGESWAAVNGIEQVTLTDATSANPLIRTWNGLPTYKTGEVGTRIHYRVVESATADNPNALHGHRRTTRRTDVVRPSDENAGTNHDVTVSLTNEQKYVTVSATATFTDTSVEYYRDISRVTFKVQRRLVAAALPADWEDLEGSAFDIVPTSADSETFEGELKSGNVPARLPRYDQNGDEYEYRCVEVSYTARAGGAETTVSRVGDRVGAYAVKDERTDFTADANNGDTLEGTFASVAANTLITENITATTTWDDDSNRDGIRPTGTKYALMRKVDGGSYASVGDAFERDVSEGRSATWIGLVSYGIEGGRYTYAVAEPASDGYVATSVRNGSDDAADKETGELGAGLKAGVDTTRASNSLAFTNTHTTAKVDVGVSKTWVDQSNAYGTRPRELSYTLQYKKHADDANWTDADVVVGVAEGDATKTAVVGQGDDAKDTGDAPCTWRGLHAYVEGSLVTYRVLENRAQGGDADGGVPGYVTENATTVRGDALEPETDGRIAITNTLETTSLTVTKSWGSDPYELKANVTGMTYKVQRRAKGSSDGWQDVVRGGQSLTDTISGHADDATCDFSGLPKTDASGIALEYRAVETSLATAAGTASASFAAGSDTAGIIGGFGFVVGATTETAGTFANTVIDTPAEAGTLRVTKTWDDDLNRDGKRTEATVTLASSGVTLKGLPATCTVSVGETGLNEVVTGLPIKDVLGNAITYILTETAVDGYEAVFSGDATSDGTVTLAATDRVAAITNRHTPQALSLTATKVWSDADDAYGDRPESVEFTLHAFSAGTELTDAQYQSLKDGMGDGFSLTHTLTRAQASTDANSWTTTWENLPGHLFGDVGRSLTYTVEESAVNGYGTSQANSTITNTQTTTTLTATMAWGPADVNLYADGATATILLQRTTKPDPQENDWRPVSDASTSTKTTPSVTGNGELTCEVAWTGLPTHDKEGRPYRYRAIERGVTIGSQSLEISHADGTSESGEVKGTDADASGLTYAASTTQAADGEGGPGTGAYTTRITNMPHTGTVTVRKAWADDNDRDGARPEGVTVTLAARLGSSEAEPAGTVTATLDKDGGWTHVWGAMPLADACGRPVYYTVSESDVPEGYVVSYDATATGTASGQAIEPVTDARGITVMTNRTTTTGPIFTVTDTHEPARARVVLTTTWDDDDDRDRVRPDLDTYKGKVRLLADGNATAEAPAAQAGGKTYILTWGNLYKYDAGRQVAYTVSEDAVEGYAHDYEGDDVAATTGTGTASSTYGATITNTHEPARVKVVLTTTWDDNDDQDGMRPDPEVFAGLAHLLADGTATAEAPTTRASGKTYTLTWENLLKFSAGAPITYSVGEDAITGYGHDYEGDTVATTAGDGTDTSTYGASITYSHVPETITVSATKTWHDHDDQDRLREDATLTLMRRVGDATEAERALHQDGTQAEERVVSKDATAGELTVSWSNLPAYAGGRLVSYHVVEAPTTARAGLTSGYDVSCAPEKVAGANGTIQVTNTHVPETVSVDITEVWNDFSNAGGTRPTSVSVRLYKRVAGGPRVEEGLVTLRASDAVEGGANAWRVSIGDLPKYEGGRTVTYTVEGVTPDGYDARVSDNEVAGYDDKTTDKDDFAYRVTNTVTAAIENKIVVSVKGWTYGDDAKDPVVTADFGDPTITYYTDEACTKETDVSDGAATRGGRPAHAGTYFVRATVAATDDYVGGSATASLTIAKRPLGISAKSATMVYDGTALTKESYVIASGTLAEGDEIDGVTVTGSQRDAGSSANVPTDAVIRHGDVDVSGSYAVTYANGRLTVEKATPALSVTISDWSYGDKPNPPELAGNLGNGPVDWRYVGETNAGAAYDEKTPPIEAGDYAVTAVVSETDNYQGGTTSCDMTVNRARPELSVSIESWVRGQEPMTPTLSGNAGGGAVTWRYEGTTGAGVAYDSSVAPSVAGDYQVTATVAETDNYQGGMASAGFFVEQGSQDTSEGSVLIKREDEDSRTLGVDTKGVETQLADLAALDDTVIDETQCKDVSITLSVTTVPAESVDAADRDAIEDAALSVVPAESDAKTDFMDLTLEKVVSVYEVDEKGNTTKASTVATTVARVGSVLDIPVAYDLTGLHNPTVVRCHEGEARTFVRLYERPAKLRDATFWVEGSGKDAVIHIYTMYFSTYAVITYGDEELPPPAKPTVEEAPKARSLTYTGVEQALVSGGVASVGEMRYALGNGDVPEDDAFVPTVPTATDVGTYRVWYRAFDEGTYLASEPASVLATIGKGTISVVSGDVSVTYDGAAHGIDVKAKTPASGATVMYGTEEGTYDLRTSPTLANVGTLTVFWQVSAENYETITGTAKVSVSPCPVKVRGIEAKDKPYDGTTDCALDWEGATITPRDASVLVEGVRVVRARGSFEDAEAGTGKTVAITDVTLEGDRAANYELDLTGSDLVTKATIYPIDPTLIAAPSARTLTYTGSPQALLIPGMVQGGTLLYRVDATGASGRGGNGHDSDVHSVPTDGWSVAVPVATDAGSHVVSWKVVGDANHNELAGGTITSTIAKAEIHPSVTIGDWTEGQQPCVPRVTGNPGGGEVSCRYRVPGTDAWSESIPTKAGNYELVATVAETDNYLSGSAGTTFAIVAKADPTPAPSRSTWPQVVPFALTYPTHGWRSMPFGWRVDYYHDASEASSSDSGSTNADPTTGARSPVTISRTTTDGGKAHAGTDVTRLAGHDRYETAARVSSEAFASSPRAVVASGSSFADALAASGLSGAYRCPVILTDGARLSGEARSELARLGTTSVTIVGGADSVSESVRLELEGMGIIVTRVAGSDRTSTSVAAMRALRATGGGSDVAVVASGSVFADALAMGPWAYASSSPVLLASADGTLSREAVEALRADSGIKRVVVVGGEKAVSAGLEDQLPWIEVERVGGADRYETAVLVARWATTHGMSYGSVGLATGHAFPDALAASALIGSRGGVLLLADAPEGPATTLLHDVASQIKTLYVLGGDLAVSKDVEGAMLAALA